MLYSLALFTHLNLSLLNSPSTLPHFFVFSFKTACYYYFSITFLLELWYYNVKKKAQVGPNYIQINWSWILTLLWSLWI